MAIRKKKKIATRIATKTRKELRKEKRTKKKENKREYFSKKKDKKTVKPKEPESKSKKSTSQRVAIESVPKIKKNDVTASDRLRENRNREKTKQHELEKKMRKRRIEQMKASNEEDDKIIHKLEKKLKIDKHKNDKSVHKMFCDGLDYALELCLPDNVEKMYSAAKESANLEFSEDDLEEDMAIVLGKHQKGKSNKNISDDESVASSEPFENDSESVSGSDSEMGSSDDEDVLNDFEKGTKKNLNTPLLKRPSNISDADSAGYSSDVSQDEHETGDFNEFEQQTETENSDDEAHNSSSAKENNKLWEDIYGRKRDQDGNVIPEQSQKYVPPHVRARLECTGEDDDKRKQNAERIKRQAKGFLNRLSEANMHKIATEIENMYLKNSRYDMNHALSALVLEAVVSNVLCKERMVLEHAMLIALLHANVGSEVGAHFLQILITKFDQLMKSMKCLLVEDKELDNVVFLLAHLYTFKIMQHSLVFEIIKQFIENLCEKSVECILLLLRSIGFQLRKEDPIALKELIFLIQKTTSEAPLEMKENPRLKFMLEVLNAVKNNNMNKVLNYDPSLAEHLKKILKSMLTNGKYIATLNITMSDLLKADEKGKWWVVGSAWSGNIKDIGAASKTDSKNENEKFSKKLLALAHEQRMNTDDRRNVFCIIMSAEDYIDAFEKLLRLSIRDQRVIASIIIHCSLSEKSYNPYYSVLAQKFSEYDRKYQLAIQFAAWDRIKDIHSLKKNQVTNFSKFLLHLIVSGGFPISVLKVVDFTELDKITLRFVRLIILELLLGKEDECRNVFAKIAPSKKLTTFKDSLRLFMHHFLLKNKNQDAISEEQMVMLKSRITLVDTVLSFEDSRVKF